MKQLAAKNILPKLDSVGKLVSLACALHCLLLPFVITILPLVGLEILGDHEFEKFMLIGTVSLALFALCWGHRVHKESKILWMPAIALGLFSIGMSIEHEHLGHAIFVALGGGTIALGHYLNTRLCKTCKDCCEHDHQH